MLKEDWLVDYRLLKRSSITALDNRYIVNNSTLPAAVGNNEHPIVHCIGSI